MTEEAKTTEEPKEATEDEGCIPFPKTESQKQVEHLQSRLKEQSNCDAVFQVGPDDDIVELKANRSLMSMMIPSPAMKELLYGAEEEKEVFTPENPKIIRIPEMLGRQFECLIKYCYLLDPEVQKKDAQALIEVFARFGLEDLSTMCSALVDGGMKVEEFLPQLQASLESGDETLTLRCMGWFSKRPDEHVNILNSDEFKVAPPPVVRTIAQSKYLLCKEEQLWEAICQWSEKWSETQGDEASAEDALRMMLEFIRFPLMEGEFFAKNVVPKKILPQDHCYLLLRRMYDPSIEVPYTTERRSPIGPFYAKRFNTLGGSWGYGGSKDVLDFKVSEEIVILGFGVNPPNRGDGRAVFEVLRVDNQEVVGRGEQDITGLPNTENEAKKVPVVKLDDSLRIEKDVWYQVQLLQTGSESRQCTSCNRSVTFTELGIDLRFDFRDFQNIINGGSSNSTSSSSGQIPTIEFLIGG